MTLLTEARNPRSADIDLQSTQAMLEIMNDEDSSVANAVRRAIPQISAAVDLIAQQLSQGGRLIYAGSGTSGRLAMLDAVECVPTFGTDPDLVQALIAGGHTALTRSVEGAEDDMASAQHDLQALELRGEDVVVGIAASGRTPYVIAALAEARRQAVPCIAISCNPDTPIVKNADIAIVAAVGPEVVTGSTRLKAGTAQKMILNMMSTAVMIKLGKVYGNLMVDVQTTNAKLVDRAQRIVSDILDIEPEAAAQLLERAEQDVKSAVVMGWADVSLPEARQMLQEAKGRLRTIIG